MAYISQYQYYENGGVSPEDSNWGSYQYVSLEDIVNNFMLMYTGNHSLVNNEERYKVLFHAKRAIQELNYDAFKEIKILERSVCDTLRYDRVTPELMPNIFALRKSGISYSMFFGDGGTTKSSIPFFLCGQRDFNLENSFPKLLSNHGIKTTIVHSNAILVRENYQNCF